MSGKTKDKCARDRCAREKIITAARTVFSDRGYHGASVNLIATEAGVNKALLFYYFHSKRNLYQEIIREVFDNFRENVTITNEPSPRVEDRFREIIGLYVKEFSRNRDITKIIIREFIGLGVGMIKDLVQFEKQTRQPLVDIISEGIERKVFRNVNPNIAAGSIIGILHMFYRHPFDLSQGMTDEEKLEQILELIYNGILTGGNAENE